MDALIPDGDVEKLQKLKAELCLGNELLSVGQNAEAPAALETQCTPQSLLNHPSITPYSHSLLMHMHSSFTPHLHLTHSSHLIHTHSHRCRQP